MTAIIYDKRGHPISIGENSYIKTHPYQKKLADAVGMPERMYLHAEIHAITRCKDLSKAHSIFISRYNSHGQPMNAKPCPICTRAIKLAGIKKISYTI